MDKVNELQAFQQYQHYAEQREKLGRNPADLPDAVYVIESPSPEDMLARRDEGEALARTLALAGIEVHYFLAVNEEMVEAAFEKIPLIVKDRPDWAVAMPWVHFSAHGHPDGMEMTDGQILYWPVLTRSLIKLALSIGPVLVSPEYNQDIPKASLSLSSCGAFDHYYNSISGNLPVQSLVGTGYDVGWCESLIAFSTFYYQALSKRSSVARGVQVMNLAIGSEEGESATFKWVRPHSLEKKVEGEKLDQN